MSRVRTFTARAAARRFRRAIRQALGLPRSYTEADVHSGEVVRHGGGRHAPLSEIVTADHAHVLRRPDGGRWAYPIDRVVRRLEGRVENVGGTDVTISAVGERDVDTGGDTPWAEDNGSDD